MKAGLVAYLEDVTQSLYPGPVLAVVLHRMFGKAVARLEKESHMNTMERAMKECMTNRVDRTKNDKNPQRLRTEVQHG